MGYELVSFFSMKGGFGFFNANAFMCFEAFFSMCVGDCFMMIL